MLNIRENNAVKCIHVHNFKITLHNINSKFSIFAWFIKVLKKILPIVLFAAILLQSTSRLWVLGSFYMNREYISAELCVNRFDNIPLCKGQCFLTQELTKQEKQEKDLPDLVQKEMQVLCKEFPNLELVDAVTEKNKPSCHIQVIKTSNYPSSIFHPPPVA